VQLPYCRLGQGLVDGMSVQNWLYVAFDHANRGIADQRLFLGQLKFHAFYTLYIVWRSKL
jgi:hypothetical protein